MNYYHYTQLKAFSSILQENPTKDKEICFWATRYDCFKDKTEYKHGIAKIYPALDNFENQSKTPDDRKIAKLFNITEVQQAIGLPVPYIISISARNDNDYMWENYADKGRGVVMELEFNKSKDIYESALYSIESCIYDSNITNEELQQFIKEKYFEMTGIMLCRNKELAIFLLRNNPTVFVRFIAIYLLAFVAPRFKKDEFLQEEESRIIISSPTKEYNSLFDKTQYPAALRPSVEKIRNFVDSEKQRKDNNNFFREFYLPISVLKRIYVRENKQKHVVEEILKKRGLISIPVEVMKQSK